VYVPNVTVSLPEDVYRRARIRAAEQNVSLSALVRRILLDVGSAETDFERRKRLQDEVLASVSRFSAAKRLSRDKVHARALR
jgi:plasmid stability protein